jgi:dTDP-4-amino-4,6-dideoxygalactose transaminase
VSLKNASVNIPFLDLVSLHVSLEAELAEVFHKTLRSAAFIGGQMVEEFESKFAEFCGVTHAIAVSSGTDALRFALIAGGVKAGDAVLTVPHTFIATAEAISQAQAVPEFIDVDEQTYNMSAEKLREYIEHSCVLNNEGMPVSLRSGRTITAVVPVHLYGQMADMDSILSVANQYRLMVIEDACQAHGAEYFSRQSNRWIRAGSAGRAAAFSFYPGKNLGACGEGGAVTTNDCEIADKVRMLRDHGQSKKYAHEIEGYNGRLDAIQAGILSVKLPYLSEWNRKRRELAEEYNRLLSSEDQLITPKEPSWSRAVYHLYVIRTTNRDEMIEYLRGLGIGTGIHYPTPLHMQRAYAFLKYAKEDYPVASRIASEIISLPMYPQLSIDQLAQVSNEVLYFAKEHACLSSTVGR